MLETLLKDMTKTVHETQGMLPRKIGSHVVVYERVKGVNGTMFLMPVKKIKSYRALSLIADEPNYRVEVRCE
jgi:hypothetical protein